MYDSSFDGKRRRERHQEIIKEVQHIRLVQELKRNQPNQIEALVKRVMVLMQKPEHQHEVAYQTQTQELPQFS